MKKLTCTDERTISLTLANIDHNHIYLSKHMDMFPKDVTGGSSKRDIAKRNIKLHLHGVGSMDTDIDGSKKFFRSRGPIREFIKQNHLRAGDVVRLMKHGAYEYELQPERLARQTISASAPTVPQSMIETLEEATTFPIHGKIKCRACFSGTAQTRDENQWRITNDPGAWGSSDPKYLVLGFSKGFTQADAYMTDHFDKVAFAKFRPRLKSVLVRLGLLSEGADIDSLMTSQEQDWAFGSLVRCSLCRKDSKSGSWAATGPLIKKSFVEQPAATYISTCAERYLGQFSEQLRIGILLGNDDKYIDGLKSVFRKLHPNSFADINAMAFRAGGVIWVNVAHPSGSNGHLQSWLDANKDTKQGKKARQAIEAILLQQ